MRAWHVPEVGGVGQPLSLRELLRTPCEGELRNHESGLLPQDLS